VHAGAGARSGYSGNGKASVVNELHKLLVTLSVGEEYHQSLIFRHERERLKVWPFGHSKLTRRPAFAVVARYGLAVASVATAIGTTLILTHYNFPAHFISHFTLDRNRNHFFGAPGQVQVCSLTYFLLWR